LCGHLNSSKNRIELERNIPEKNFCNCECNFTADVIHKTVRMQQISITLIPVLLQEIIVIWSAVN